MIRRLFDRGDRTPVTPVTAPAVSFGERAHHQLVALSVITRQAGRDLDADAYSLLRHVEDLLRPTIADAAEHPILPEREHAIETMLTDLIPNTIAAFLRIPAPNRRPGSEAATSLRAQLTMLGESAAEIDALIKHDAVSALQANAFLLESRLR